VHTFQSVHQKQKKNRMNSAGPCAAEKIIVALDVSTREEAFRLVAKLAPGISTFKVGLQLYTAEGPDIVRAILDTGAKVFLDLKMHDIPNTVARAVEAAGKLGVQMLTIHLSGGSAMIEAAVAACNQSLALLGVTVLTSIDRETLHAIGIESEVSDHVLRLAQLGARAGINGLVASPHEIGMLRKNLGDRLRLVIPGVRPSGSNASDQKRVMTPRDALEAGADYLVIGRPITADPDPAAALARILAEISR
jgi:orotidine-5'-phosphate decarboxylase